MFQKNMINHEVAVYCTDGINEVTYTFIESYDEHWDDIGEQKFIDGFGTCPTSIKRVSYVAV